MSGTILNFLTSHLSILKSEFWLLFVSGLANGFLYGMVAVGYTLVYGVLRLINFAHSEIFTAGAFGGYFVMRGLVGTSVPSGFGSVVLIVLGIVMGGVVGAVMAMLLERVAYRPLRRRNAPKLAYLISAIGASYFLYNLYGKEFGRNPTSVPQPFTNNSSVFSIFGAGVSTYDIIIFVSGAVMLFALDRVVAKTKLGRGIRAVAQDPETASLMGVNIDRTIMLTFIIGGALGGAAGFLFAINSNVTFTMGFTPALKAFSAAVLGGIGNLRGAMLGGLLLGVAENLSVAFVSSAYIDVVAFGILVLVLLFRPTGILGERIGRAA